jgi:riboflavin synthase
MFTGLIERTGMLTSLKMTGDSGVLVIQCEGWTEPLVAGESIAVQGACLTVTAPQSDGFGCDVLKETLEKTALSSLAVGAELNLERALRLGDRLGGHMVTGHVDGLGTVESIVSDGRDHRVRIRCDAELMMGMVPKGSICIDGISLTIASLQDSSFDVCIIPTTWRETSLRCRRLGDFVNLETDVIGKYVMRSLQQEQTSPVTMDMLRNAGLC